MKRRRWGQRSELTGRGRCAASKILNSFRISYFDCTRDRKLSTTPSIINVWPVGFNWSGSPSDYREPIFHTPLCLLPPFLPCLPAASFGHPYLTLIHLVDSISMAFNLPWRTIMNSSKPVQEAKCSLSATWMMKDPEQDTILKGSRFTICDKRQRWIGDEA